jgi:hypothetical protein
MGLGLACGLHGASMGLLLAVGMGHGASMGYGVSMGLARGLSKKITRGGAGASRARHAAPAAICCVGVGRRANNPLALPSKCPIPGPADLSIADPTDLIAERDGAPLGERHETLVRR